MYCTHRCNPSFLFFTSCLYIRLQEKSSQPTSMFTIADSNAAPQLKHTDQQSDNNNCSSTCKMRSKYTQNWDNKNPDKHMMRKNQTPPEFMIEWKGETGHVKMSVWSREALQLQQVVKAGWWFHARVAVQPSMLKILQPGSMQGKLMTLIKVPRFPLMAPHWIPQ